MTASVVTGGNKGSRAGFAPAKTAYIDMAIITEMAESYRQVRHEDLLKTCPHLSTTN